MEIKTLVTKAYWRPAGNYFGWGNGYIGVPFDHPWYGKDYDTLAVNVHGGLTYSGKDPPAHSSTENIEEGYWWFGFVTAHYNDTLTTCPKSYVEAEADRLYQQAYAVYDPPTIREENDHRQIDPDI